MTPLRDIWRSLPVVVRRVGGVLGVALVVLGALLTTRPLTALIALVATIAIVLIAAAVAVVVQARTVRRLAVFLALVACAAAALVFLPLVVRSLPIALAILLGANAVRLIVLVAWAGGDLASRLTRCIFAVSSLLFAASAWIWPDVSTVVIAAAFAVALVVAGVILIVGALRTWRSPSMEGLSRGERHRTRAVLRGIGAVLALVLAGVTSWASFQLRAGTVSVDDFYAWNHPVPAVPGSVLRVAKYAGEVPAGAAAVRVLYATTYSNGRPALASAVVAYPTAKTDQPRPVLAWAHGTTGVARSCGPSVGTQALTEYAIPGISRAIGRGWVVVATDYPGQGTAGRYPYLIGEGEGRATLDGIRAAGRIKDADASDAAWIWRHSQGGHAALWAGEIADDYAPEIDVLGVAALSAASDPLAMAQRVTGAKASALGGVITSLVLVPYADEYPDVSLDGSVHPAGRGIVETFASRCVAEAPTLVSVLVASALGRDSPLYRIDVSSGPTHDRLAQNIADGLVPAPLFLGQGVADEVVPISMQRALSASLCGAGRTVETHEYPDKTHMGVIAEGSPLIDELFAWADTVSRGSGRAAARASSGSSTAEHRRSRGRTCSAAGRRLRAGDTGTICRAAASRVRQYS